MNYKLTLAFCGTRYHGWQVQPNGITVSEVLQNSVEAVYGTRYDVKGCSRTDSGVHANGFVVLLSTRENIPPASLLRALNVNLPRDVAVLRCEEAPEGFHPRYSAKGKRYLYHLYDSPVRSPFWQDRMLHVPYPLDEDRMNVAAAYFLGTHNFSAFCASGGKIPEEERIRTITHCGVTRREDVVTLSITGDGFLYNMVRIITGTLLEVSRGKIAPEEIPEIIESRDRKRAGITVSPEGLYLDAVFYEEKEAAQ